MRDRKKVSAHVGCIVCILVWGTTLVCSKILLRSFCSEEIILARFVVGVLVLSVICPKPLRCVKKIHELYFALLGFFGVTLYFMLENTALLYTYSTNVSIIISTVPFFTVLAAAVFDRQPLKVSFFVGFAVAIVGVALVSYNGTRLHLKPMGDLLTFGAVLSWVAYSLLLQKIDHFGYNGFQVSRKIFLYGLLFLMPILLLSKTTIHWRGYLEPVNWLNLGYLGIVASALIYVLWNRSVCLLGPGACSVYIYGTPVVTMGCAAVVLGEKMTGLSLLGAAMTIVGLVLSQSKFRRKKGSQLPCNGVSHTNSAGK